MILHIEVTRDDLDNGLRNDPSSCPIALAVKRALDDELGHDSVKEIEVGVDYSIYTLIWNNNELVLTDKFLDKFIIAFDNEEFVLPFQRTLKLEE